MQEVTKYNTTVYFLQLHVDDFILSSNNSYSYILLMTKGKSGETFLARGFYFIWLQWLQPKT